MSRYLHLFKISQFILYQRQPIVGINSLRRCSWTQLCLYACVCTLWRRGWFSCEFSNVLPSSCTRTHKYVHICRYKHFYWFVGFIYCLRAILLHAAFILMKKYELNYKSQRNWNYNANTYIHICIWMSVWRILGWSISLHLKKISCTFSTPTTLKASTCWKFYFYTFQYLI